MDEPHARPEFRRCLRLFVAFGSLGIAAKLVVVAVLIRTEELVGTYGWHLIPADERAYTRAAALAGAALAALGFLSSSVTFLYFLHRARRLAERTNAVTFALSWGWTIASLFVPVVNFLRPWLGFSEIHKSWKHASELRSGKGSLDTLPFGSETLVLALLYDSLLVCNFLVENIHKFYLNSMFYNRDEVIAAMRTVEGLWLADILLYVAAFLVAVTYLRSISRHIGSFFDAEQTRGIERHPREPNDSGRDLRPVVPLLDVR